MAFGGAVTVKQSLVYEINGTVRLLLKQKAGKQTNHTLSRRFFEILREILMAQLFVTLGHNQINKLIRIAPCLSIDFSVGAGIIRMIPGLNPC